MAESSQHTTTSYSELFHRATGRTPHLHQVRLATGDALPSVLHALTGADKTYAVPLAWLYRRLLADPAVRRATLLHPTCALPMRVLVEQVWDQVNTALRNLDLDGGQAGRHPLIGGQSGPKEGWARHPGHTPGVSTIVDLRTLDSVGRPRATVVTTGHEPGSVSLAVHNTVRTATRTRGPALGLPPAWNGPRQVLNSDDTDTSIPGSATLTRNGRVFPYLTGMWLLDSLRPEKPFNPLRREARRFYQVARATWLYWP